MPARMKSTSMSVRSAADRHGRRRVCEAAWIDEPRELGRAVHLVRVDAEDDVAAAEHQRIGGRAAGRSPSARRDDRLARRLRELTERIRERADDDRVRAAARHDHAAVGGHASGATGTRCRRIERRSSSSPRDRREISAVEVVAAHEHLAALARDGQPACSAWPRAFTRRRRARSASARIDRRPMRAVCSAAAST